MPEQTEEGLASKVIAVIAKEQRIPLESITLDSTFEQLKIDSLDGINIVFGLESEFRIEIPDEAANKLQSVRETVDGVAELLRRKGAQSAARSAVASQSNGSKSA